MPLKLAIADKFSTSEVLPWLNVISDDKLPPPINPLPTLTVLPVVTIAFFSFKVKCKKLLSSFNPLSSVCLINIGVLK